MSHNLEKSTYASVDGGQPMASSGALDGITLMRYAHIYRSRISGGVEQYLRRLNSGLAERHRITIIQAHLAEEEGSRSIEIEKLGQGRIVWVPMQVHHIASRITGLPARLATLYRQAQGVAKRHGQNALRAVTPALSRTLSHRLGHLRYKTAVFSEHLAGLLKDYAVDLLVMHWLNYDVDTLLNSATQAGVPYALVNHFSNARFSLPRNRYWLEHAAAIGAVSDRGLPAALQSRCVALSDAIDTDFFMPEKARPRHAAPPIVLLPARIQVGKGHRDLIEAAARLTSSGVNLFLHFAGATDSAPELQKLRNLAASHNLQERVCFLGERSVEELRDCYAASSVVALPSYSEGLGRVLLEAQAMCRPVVAYDSGGISQAVLDGETGYLVKTGDVHTLAERIRVLLDDAGRRENFGARGRDFVARYFAIPALIERHEAFYSNALSNARRQVIAERQSA